MTELAFHFGAPDKIAYACRLLRKAVGSGARVVVIGDPDQLQVLDEALWSLTPTDFVPHCLADAPAMLRKYSPVILSAGWDAVEQEHDVMVNLADQVPQGFDTFARLIEVVSLDPEDRSAARERWRFYSSQGYAIQRHDLALKSAS